MRKQIKFLLIFFFCLFPLFSVRADSLNQRVDFNVESEYSVNGQIRYSASLRKISTKLYFYFEDSFWNSLSSQEKEDIDKTLTNLGNEFDSVIYPKTTSLYGSEWIPGVDKDSKITILFHPMKENARGYFRSIDEYEKMIAPLSNQREMIYLSTDSVKSKLLNEFVAHEFVHLVEFNQKERIYNISEDTWLSEARAEYLINYLGYNNKEDSYLDQRIEDFLDRPTDSLTQWDNDFYDYGIITIFSHYLVENYGIEVLSESLKTNKSGIESIDYALTKLGKQKSFKDIFTDWSIAVYLNDCTLSQKYCFRDPNLSNLQLIPFNNLLPLSGESSLSVSQTLSPWSSHWQKFSGARSDLKIEFDGKKQNNFRVFYIIKDFSGNYELKELILDADKRGTINIPGMGKEKSSIVVIPIYLGSSSNSFYTITANTYTQTNNNPQNQDSNLPFQINKPLNQMSREELLSVLLRLIIYLILQGKLVI
ncbi:MAG TPA: hypothetical protein PKI00_01400 [Candidatus Pacearchaeota archaeon]|nr:hypothetical protein [Candidatus Pacearchaeota archaeon]